MRIVILNLFMDAVRDENAQKMTRPSFEAAQRQLLIALKRNNANSHLLEILGKCVLRLRSGVDLVVSMTIIRHLINVHHEDVYLDTHPFLEELMKTHNTLNVTINAYRAYKMMAKKISAASASIASSSRATPLQSPIFTSTDPKDLLTPSGSAPLFADVSKLVTGRNPHYCHEKYLQTFREFITLLFEQNRHSLSQFPLPVKLVRRLWQCAIDWSLSDEERDGDIRWLVRECMMSRGIRDQYAGMGRVPMRDLGMESSNAAMQLAAMNCLLANFQQLNIASISLPLFTCFKDLFLQGEGAGGYFVCGVCVVCVMCGVCGMYVVCDTAGRVRLFADKVISTSFLFPHPVNRKLSKLRYNDMRYEVLRTDLSGFDILWDVVFTTENEQVFAEAMNFLVSLHLLVSQTFAEREGVRIISRER